MRLRHRINLLDFLDGRADALDEVTRVLGVEYGEELLFFNQNMFTRGGMSLAASTTVIQRLTALGERVRHNNEELLERALERFVTFDQIPASLAHFEVTFGFEQYVSDRALRSLLRHDRDLTMGWLERIDNDTLDCLLEGDLGFETQRLRERLSRRVDFWVDANTKRNVA